MTQNDNMSLKELIHAVAEERGLDLRSYKNATIERRVRKRMHEVGVGSYSEYLEKVRQDANEVNELLNTVLINVTEFFRDPQAWEALRKDVLPTLLGNLKPGDLFRAWSAGCSTGEEAFSLAIIIADYFGPRLKEFDVKIYATDVDEDALNIARRGEYGTSRLRRVLPDWKRQYFSGDGELLRINRDIRRMVIFGRNNLLKDASISHCKLVICRNLLIYFDAAAQQQILGRLHYALDPGGVLVLGTAESRLNDSDAFRLVNLKWRIFQRSDRKEPLAGTEENRGMIMTNDEHDKYQERMETLQLEHRYLLDIMKAGVMILDSRDVITSCNEKALEVWGLAGVPVRGKRLQATDMVFRCPELAVRLEASRAAGPAIITFECGQKVNGEEHMIDIMIRPLVAEQGGGRVGTIIYAEDMAPEGKLQNAVRQLERTSEELQSSNEELETTNEELQSTNEELETTNEELQSTNEELETTNEELQSLNEELETMNEELEQRTRELNSLTARYEDTLKGLPWPVMLVDSEEKIQLWNAEAQKLFGVGMTSVVGVGLDQLPVEAELRKSLLRRCALVLEKGKATKVREQKVGRGTEFDIQFTPISRDDKIIDGVMIMFGPNQAGGENGNPVVGRKGLSIVKTAKKATGKKGK